MDQPVDDRDRCHGRSMCFGKMEVLVRELQDPENGVPVRSQKVFLTSIPAAFMGYDLVEWLMERLVIEESEAINIANQLCQNGYIFPVNDMKDLKFKDDSSLYRFQTPYYWPWQHKPPDNIEYAIYLAKRSLRNKQRHGLDEHEVEALGSLRKNLQNKWDFISMQAEEQVKLAKDRKKGDKIVLDSQERAYWRVYRPPPGCTSSFEQCPVPNRNRPGQRQRRKTVEDCRREVEILKNSLNRTRIKVSVALESMVQSVETYAEYDPLITSVQPSNPWVNEDLTYWQLNSALVELPTEKRVRRWGLSMEELVSDKTGLQEFTAYLRKEYSHENIRFWTAVNDLRRSSQSQIQRKVAEIFEEFLAPGAPCEINIDGKTMEKVVQELRSPTRFTFDAAAEHVYTLLLKKDCYPRFIRSEHYKNLLASGIQPSQKKRFFGFGPTKKKSSTTNPPQQSHLQQQATSNSSGIGSTGSGSSYTGSGLSRRRGSDRSLSGSAHELAISGVRDNSRVPHSHSQSNLTDIPYREPSVEPTVPCGVCPWEEAPSQSTAPQPDTTHKPKKPSIAVLPGGASTSEDICPWEAPPPDSEKSLDVRSRKNSTQMDSGSSSSDISLAIAEVSDRLRKTCVLPQQSTFDSDRRGQSKKLSAATGEVRRSSISIPTRGSDRPSAVLDDWANKSDGGEDSDLKKKPQGIRKACSVSSANPPTISVSSVTDEIVTLATPPLEEAELEEIIQVITPTPTEETLAPSTGEITPSRDTSSSPDEASKQSTPIHRPELLEETPAVQSTSTELPPPNNQLQSSPTTVSPNTESTVTVFHSPPTTTITITPSVVTPTQTDGQSRVPQGTDSGGEEAGSSCTQDKEVAAPKDLSLPVTLAPLAVPDGESPGSEWAPEVVDETKNPETGDAAQEDGKANDICPWEDEEACKVDTPFVKTYATLGYL